MLSCRRYTLPTAQMVWRSSGFLVIALGNKSLAQMMRLQVWEFIYVDLSFWFNHYVSHNLSFPCSFSAFAKEKGATFTMLGKIDCGSEKDVSHPLFLFLTENGAIKWNFTKVC